MLENKYGDPPTEYDIDAWVSSHAVTTAPILEGSKEKMIDPQDGTVDDPGATGYLLGAYPTYINIGRDIDRNDNKKLRTIKMLKIAFGQSKMIDKPIVGLLHIVVYVGFLVINIELLEIIVYA